MRTTKEPVFVYRQKPSIYYSVNRNETYNFETEKNVSLQTIEF